jgi:cell division protein FtsB
VPLVKSVQELEQTLKEMRAENAAMKKEIEALKNK